MAARVYEEAYIICSSFGRDNCRFPGIIHTAKLSVAPLNLGRLPRRAANFPANNRNLGRVIAAPCRPIRRADRRVGNHS